MGKSAAGMEGILKVSINHKTQHKEVVFKTGDKVYAIWHHDLKIELLDEDIEGRREVFLLIYPSPSNGRQVVQYRIYPEKGKFLTVDVSCGDHRVRLVNGYIHDDSRIDYARSQ